MCFPIPIRRKNKPGRITPGAETGLHEQAQWRQRPSLCGHHIRMLCSSAGHYYTTLHYTLLRVLYYTPRYRNTLNFSILYDTILYCTVLHCTCTVVDCSIVCKYTILHYAIPYHTIPYCTMHVQHKTILTHPTLYYTRLPCVQF
jgi:hypothetical protein